MRLYVRIQQPGSSAYDGYMLRTIQQTGTDQVLLERLDNGAIVTRLTILQELVVGDTLLLRAKGTTIEAWRHDGSVWAGLGLITDSTYGAAGYAGIGLRGTTGRLEDFGARTYGAASAAPSAPQSLGATAGNNQVALSWSAPSSNGGSALTSYTVYRSTTTGVLGSALSPGPGLSTSYTDTTATNGTNYYYVVKASNAVGESLPSNEASATPSAPLLPPVEPLPVVDSFNRRNENPLSGAGLWSNGIIGSAETGLRVMSNQLECTRTTTCTAWRNNTFYGPDTEASARITTLPGNGNSFLLYVRLNQAGAGGSGYRLRTLQQSGVDQVFIERIDGGVIVTRLTMNQELAVGDTLLLRATGQSLEAWHKRGTAWTKLGAVTDSAYQSAGRVGVGIRGKTGRLDDFGAR